MDIGKSLSGAVDTAKADPKVQAWLKELDAARKRVKEYRKDASRVVKLYEGGKASESPFNILYSNTETLAPALYNNPPRPVVQRRFKDDDPLGKVASDVARRSLEFLIDNELGDYTPFDDLMSQAVLEALVPGSGVTWFRYDAAITEQPEPNNPTEGQEDATGEGEIEATQGEIHDEPLEQVEYETVCGEAVPWDRFLHGYAKQWKDVPWVAREHFMTRDELVKNFGEEIGHLIPLNISGKAQAAGSHDGDEEEKVTDAEGVDLGHVFEIWDKETKMVRFLAPSYPAGFVKEVEDPLQLSGFFPMPRPLVLFPKISSLVPVPLYTMYEEQAKELNRITVRINKIVQALKVRGFYDSTLEGLDKVLAADDNVLIPAENVAAMQQGQTLEKAIWLMPLEKLVAVLQQLYVQRQQVKQVIYEITGISDILRGASVASETATAQNIKNQWGTLRLKKMQKQVARYVRDCLRIMGEIAMTKFSQQTLSQMTGLQFPTAQQKQQAQAMLQQLQMQAQQQPQVPGQPPAQPPAPPPQILAAAQLPSWEEIMGLLTNDLQRNYRIDIETNSTVDAEATEDKQNMGEFLNAVAQFMNGVAPLVQQGTMPFDAAKSILLAVTRRYRFGPEVEDELKKMQPPQPQGNGADVKAKADLEAAQAEQKVKMEMLAMDKQLKEAETAAKLEELKRKGEFAAAQHAMKLQELRLKLATPKLPGVTQP
jgi:hypothetical protein